VCSLLHRLPKSWRRIRRRRLSHLRKEASSDVRERAARCASRIERGKQQAFHPSEILAVLLPQWIWNLRYDKVISFSEICPPHGDR
jgi:hypothetical protein